MPGLFGNSFFPEVSKLAAVNQVMLNCFIGMGVELASRDTRLEDTA